MKRYDAILAEFAEETTLAAKRSLGSRRIGKNRSYGVATRELQKSLEFTIDGATIRFGSPVAYAGFVHWGVNGTRKNRSSPYSFKYDTPGRKHVQAIMEWMRVKPVRLRDEDGKFVKQTPYVSERTGERIDPREGPAFAIARAIKRRGLPGVKYWTEALETMVPRYRERLVEAKTLDLFDEMFVDLPNVKLQPKL